MKMEHRRILNLFVSSYLVIVVVLGASKSSPILRDNRISLQCQHDCMLVELDLQDIPKLKPTSLHLRQFSCRPHKVTSTRATFRVPFQGCGTTRGIDANHIVYQNVVGNSQEFNETRLAVRHVPELYYPFACRYRKKYTLTLKDGEMKEQTNESGHSKANSKREDFPQGDAGSSSSVPCAHLHFLGCLLLVIYVWL